jgi:hypothetical protein
MVKEEHIFLWTILAAFAKLFLYGSSSARHNPPARNRFTASDAACCKKV